MLLTARSPYHDVQAYTVCLYEYPAGSDGMSGVCTVTLIGHASSLNLTGALTIKLHLYIAASGIFVHWNSAMRALSQDLPRTGIKYLNVCWLSPPFRQYFHRCLDAPNVYSLNTVKFSGIMLLNDFIFIESYSGKWAGGPAWGSMLCEAAVHVVTAS